jgi:hypothetical protein
MELLHMIVVGSLLLELESAGDALDPFAEMHHFDVPIEVMFISETHAAVLALVAFDVGMGDHVAFQMRPSFERLSAVFLLADVIP